MKRLVSEGKRYPNPNIDPSSDCQEAISLDISLLTSSNIDLSQYKLVSAENLIKGPTYAGPYIWRLTFKLKRLIPQFSNKEVGAGELFVETDLATKKDKLLGYGINNF